MKSNFRNPFDQTDDERRHTEIVGLLNAILTKLETIMVDTTKLAADVAALKTAVATAITDLGALSTDIAALKAQIAASGDPAQQAAVDAIDQTVTGIASDLSTATTANPA
jgi:phage shock protein A